MIVCGNVIDNLRKDVFLSKFERVGVTYERIGI